MTLAPRSRALPMVACLLALGAVFSQARAQTSLLNVSYDPTRELYRDVNAQFAAVWQSTAHQTVSIKTSGVCAGCAD